MLCDGLSRNGLTKPSTVFHVICLPLTGFVFSCAAFAQTTAPAIDSRALAITSKAIVKMVGIYPLRSMLLTGQVVMSEQDSESSSITLKAYGVGESRIDIATANGPRSEIRDASTGIPQGKWVNEDGTSGPFALHNVMTDPVWFYPALGSLAGGSNLGLAYVGQEIRNGQTVEHIRAYSVPNIPSFAGGPSAAHLSSIDFYLDATSFLPAAEVFSEHPDGNANVDIQVEVNFSNYQSISGVQIPMHIVRTVNGSPALAITIQSAQLNAGLTLSDFSLN